MESKARHIFRDLLALHYIEDLDAGPLVETWLKNHGGWFPDPQEMYGDGTPLTAPVDEGEDATSADPARAMEDARALMPKLMANLTKEVERTPDDDVYAPIAKDVTVWMKACDRREGRERSRSRSPLRVDPMSEVARAALDVVCKHDADPRVEEQRATIARLRQELAAKDAEIADLRIGHGSIGPIIVENMKEYLNDAQRAQILAKTEPVKKFIWRMSRAAHAMDQEMVWGSPDGRGR